MTITDYELIPPVFWPAIELTPDCMALRSAIADCLLENGDEDGAECMRWSIEKRRTMDTFGWTPELADKPSTIPASLYLITSDWPVEIIKGDGYALRLRWLIWRWLHATPEQRQSYWQWQPPTGDSQ